jgi:hypothetical protein
MVARRTIALSLTLLVSCALRAYAQEEAGSRDGMAPPVPVAADLTEAQRQARDALAALVPRAGDADLPAGVTQEGEVRVYGREQLGDYIDGDAESFYPHGVTDTASATYTVGEGARLEMDLFDMATDLGAFGIYGHRRPEGIEPLAIGTQGYVVKGKQVVFLAGRYYGVVRVVSKQPEAVDVARALAEAVGARVPEPHDLPAELGLLPEDNAVANSGDYFPSDYLALAGMPPVFVGGYAIAGEPKPTRYRLAFTPAYASPEEAQAAFAATAEVLATRAVTDSRSDAPVVWEARELAAARGELKYRGPYLAALVGRRIVIVTGLAHDAADSAAIALAERLLAHDEPTPAASTP